MLTVRVYRLLASCTCRKTKPRSREPTKTRRFCFFYYFGREASIGFLGPLSAIAPSSFISRAKRDMVPHVLIPLAISQTLVPKRDRTWDTLQLVAEAGHLAT